MIKSFLSYIIELLWIYAELHMIKIILLCVMILAVYEVSKLLYYFIILILMFKHDILNNYIRSV